MIEQDQKILQEKRNVPESAFKLHYPQIYERIQEEVKALHIERWNEAKYIYTNQIKERPTCKICGKPVEFISVNRGYKATCSRECDIILKSQANKGRKHAQEETQRSTVEQEISC